VSAHTLQRTSVSVVRTITLASALL